ncbi:MAG: hypothetical protein JW982_12480 [Spirochaetes bacterium]|nr:hypothetical protein [Spirochaetota bacterium]
MESSIRININAKLLIADFSEKSGISMCSVAKILLQKVDMKFKTTPSTPGLIKYQIDQPEYNWDVLHYRLSQCEKEQFEGMRIKYKLSISFLVLIGIFLFLDELIKEFFGEIQNIEKICYNYPALINLKILYRNSCWILRETIP